MEDKKNILPQQNENMEDQPETIEEVAEEILEEDAQAFESEKDAREDIETIAQAQQQTPELPETPDVSEDDSKAEEPAAQSEERVEEEASQTVPPELPKARHPWTRRTVSVAVCFGAAACFYLGGIINGIHTVANEASSSRVSNDVRDFDRSFGRDMDDFFNDFDDYNDYYSDDQYDRDGNFRGFSFNSYEMPALSSPSSSSRAANKTADYTAAWGAGICGTLFACTGILLLNKQEPAAEDHKSSK